ncbi:MAG: AAA family ATPase [Patescibacteria group bacterium]
MEQPQSEERKTRKLEGISHDPIGYFLRSREVAEDPAIAQIEPTDKDFSRLSPGERAESLWSTFQNIKRLWKERRAPEKGKKSLPKETLRKVQLRFAILKALYQDEETRQAYIAGNEKHLQEIESINGEHEKYEALQKQIKEAERAIDALAREMFAHRRQSVDEVDKLLYEDNARQLQEKLLELQELLNYNPELSSLAKYETLKEYSRQYRENNYMWSPSRREALEEIESAALSGKPAVLISGESGVGKTALIEQASIVLTGETNSTTPGKDIRFQDLVAQPKIDASGRTYYEYKEIGEAATGKSSTLDTVPIHQGRIVADEEFNLLERAEQTNRLARLSTWVPGKQVRMPVTGELVIIAPNYLYCAPVNLASEHFAREKIPLEVLRKFAKANVDYVRQTSKEPEIYEMMLGALMDENGRIRVAREELAPYFEEREEVESVTVDEKGHVVRDAHGQQVKRTVRIRELHNERVEETKTVPAGGFVWRFANAIGELNKSISHKETVLKSSGDAQFLKDLVIDIGDILGWLREHESRGRTKSIEEFVLKKLNSQFLTKAEYSLDDRQLAKDFFRHFGIDTDKTFDETSAKPQFEILTPADVGLLSPRVRYYKVLSSEPMLAEAAFINEDGERVEYYIRPYQAERATYIPGQVIKDNKGKYVEFLGVRKSDGEPVITPYKEKTKKIEKKKRGKHTESQAETIMGKYFLGAKAVKEAFGVELSSSEIPPIPFSQEDLERAKELGQSLILRIDRAPDGTPLTMKKMNELLEDKVKKAKDGKILYKIDWYKDEEFFTIDTPKISWALTGREIVSGSTNKDYWSQTEVIANLCKEKVFEGQSLPAVYQEAWDEWEREKAVIRSLVFSDWQEAAHRLSELKLNQLFRQTPAEAMYDNLILFQNTKERSLETMYIFTSRRSSDGYLVVFGNADAWGAFLHRWKPANAHGLLGVVLSRHI